MKKQNKLLNYISIILGLSSITFFVFYYIVLTRLQPKMISFATITPAEEDLLNWVGVGLLLLLVFLLLSLLQIAQSLKNAKKITIFSLLLVAVTVVSFLSIFSDVALLSDIGKQYRHGLAQPEWSLLYPIMAFQFLTCVVLTGHHLSGLQQRKKQVKHVVRDNNIFLVTQYVGLICGLLGFAFAGLGFLFPKGLNVHLHVTLSSIVLLTPYALAVGFWLATKLQEAKRQLYDEKQLQDICKSALLTLVSSVIFMTALFIANYGNLSGVVSIMWLPLYLFFVLSLFSAGNLFFSCRDA